MDISSKESTYDFMAILLPGSLALFLLYITILLDLDNDSLFDEYSFLKYIILLTVSYLTGLAIKSAGEKLFNRYLRNKDSHLRDALAKCDVGKDFNDLKDYAFG